MNKGFAACGLVPALVLGTCGTVGAQPAAVEAPAQMTQVAASDGMAEPVTQESLQQMRRQLEEQLQQAQELQQRLNAQLDSLDKPRRRRISQPSTSTAMDDSDGISRTLKISRESIGKPFG